MIELNNASTTIRSINIVGRHQGDGDSVRVDLRLQLEVPLAPSIVERVPWVSRAVIELMKVSGDGDGEAGKDTIDLTIKRSFAGAQYQLPGATLHGTVANAVKVRIVKGEAALRWAVDADVDVAVLPALGALVGAPCEASVVPDQLDLADQAAA